MERVSHSPRLVCQHAPLLDQCVLLIMRCFPLCNNSEDESDLCGEMKQMLTGVKCEFCSRSHIWCRQTSGVNKAEINETLS